MTYPFANNLKLNKKEFQKSIYNTRTVKINEYVDRRLIDGFIQDVKGIEFTYHPQKQNFPNELVYITEYNKFYDVKTKCFKTKLFFPKHKWGRAIPVRGLSLSMFHRPTRHALAIDHYIDIDMVNASQNIINEVMKQNDIEVPAIAEYCKHRDRYLDFIIKHYGCDKKKAKQLIIALSFGGGYDKWIKDNDFGEKDKIQEVMNLEADYKNVMSHVWKVNSIIIDDVLANDPDYFKEYSTNETTLLNAKKRTCMSLFYQTIERHFQEGMIEFLVKERMIKLEDIIPCQDGFMIPKTGFYDGILAELEAVQREKWGFVVPMVMKPFDEAIEIPYAEVPDEIEEKKDGNWKEIFNDIYPQFEETHAKIVNTSSYVLEKNDEVIVMSHQKLKNTYEYIECGKNALGSDVAFIDKWVRCNNKIRKFDSMEIYPNPEKCPSNVFNLWRPFAMELQTGEYEKRPEALERFIEHINILCDRQDEVKVWFVKWMAQMIQQPERKSQVPTLISKQGSGKNTLIDYGRKLLGDSKVVETTTPSRDVWGQFNGMMTSAYLVNLDELSKKEQEGAEGQIKALITSPKLWINQKGINQFQVNSYHRFIITTNNEDPLKTAEGDRRNLIIRCSDEKKGNKEYFDALYGDMEDMNALRTIYDYLKYDVVVEDTFYKSTLPETNHHNELKKLNRKKPDLWLEDFTYENKHVPQVILAPADVLKKFNTWCEGEGIEYNIDSQKLGVQLSQLRITDGIKPDSSKRMKVFDIGALKKHYKIDECLIST